MKKGVCFSTIIVGDSGGTSNVAASLFLSLTLFNTIFYLDDAANGQKASMVITYSTFAKRNRAPSSTIFVILSVTISSFK